MEKTWIRLSLALLCISACFSFYANRVLAHDLWLNIDNHSPAVGQKTNIKVVFGHNFPYYDILVQKDELPEFCYFSPDGEKKEITKTWEDRQGEKAGGALVGEMSIDQKGTYVVGTYRKRKGDKEHVPSEKYGKSIIIAGKGNANINRQFGHRIEIIPLKNPQELKPGDSLPVKILFEGKPLSTYLYATYAGYYSEDEPFPVLSKSNDQGEAQIKISKPGIWMVVGNHKVDFSASLTFEIK
ncbi:MAG: DUF4198 domain-containing protein [bacterium]